MTEAHDLAAILASLALGAALGLGFYIGLRATVNGIGRARRPVARILTSLVVRFAIVLLVFLMLARYAGWPELVAAALGFMAVRPLVLLGAGGRKQHREKRA